MLLSALSCTKESGPEAGSDELIAVGAQVARTKAMITEGQFAVGSSITVYNAQADMADVGVEYVTENGELNWYYTDRTAQYRWTEGTHKFFGWVTMDAGMRMTPDTFFGTGFSYAGQTLSVPEKTMDASADQFDFVYSDLYYRNYVKGAPGSADRVILDMKHLFSAFKVTGKNMKNNTVVIKDITISGLNLTKSATIDFSKEVTVSQGNDTRELATVTYNERNDAPEGTFTFAPNQTLTTTEADLINTFMVWPQDAGDLENAKMTITYAVTEGNDETTDRVEVELKSLKDAAGNVVEWKAGYINKLNIVFDIKQITFVVIELVSWNEEEQDIPVQM